MLYRQEASPSKSQPKLFHLITIWMGPVFVSFFLHQFPAHLETRGGCSHGEVLDEAGKLPGAGIGPRPAPENARRRKAAYRENRNEEQTRADRQFGFFVRRSH